MIEINETPIDRAKFNQMKAELGVNFLRVLGYYREDGAKTIAQIEEAARSRSAVGLVRPAHTLKGESLQFGAVALGLAAERIEMAARAAVEARNFCEGVSADVAQLGTLFAQVLEIFDRENAAAASPVRRVVGFGRKTGFGRA